MMKIVLQYFLMKDILLRSVALKLLLMSRALFARLYLEVKPITLSTSTLYGLLEILEFYLS